MIEAFAAAWLSTKPKRHIAFLLACLLFAACGFVLASERLVGVM